MAENNWNHLERRPKSFYRQLYVKGTRIRADVVYYQYAGKEPMTAEEIAGEYNLPVEAVREAIAYCESEPVEIMGDRAREEMLSEASGMNDPNYDGKPKILSPGEMARILRS